MFPFAFIPQDLQSSFNFCQPLYQFPWMYPYSQYGNFSANYLPQFPRINCSFQQPEIHSQPNQITTPQIQGKSSKTFQRSFQNEPIETPTSIDHNQSINMPVPILNKKKKKKSTKSKFFKKGMLLVLTEKGHWTNKEHRLYIQFIESHKEIMSDSDQKKMNKIFKQMSDFLKTRSASQCRSHHQKFNPYELTGLSAVKNSSEFKIVNE
ncbi:unnamed protein product (macronuclear) [Paramecium tetraurelia]|uniref:Myb-like domain-containing protein n=1 Tax=Paramecium tetraurelia TaxID=5888 RepID=A0BEW3_PARTE|nr:uncharacterized protein GSPATT00028114001 [Paramecium tetraurelia]CAK57080.1 unnamed protein product [Paramecium tetraurelia]|eukprot:XP_001424478.1 hypothetical protein (macronuclear) [Paramecium tetraurelia strain d4-2]